MIQKLSTKGQWHNAICFVLYLQTEFLIDSIIMNRVAHKIFTALFTKTIVLNVI